ncbi:hypothetical protein L914_09139 [Phytophthora nicotianae]|uniref:Chromo domain-containing protein n=1 Tax=Phytophthora nicotianae TaxID=4792 RepID=W2NB85_PHYNI|nr:hypothetical protein L914_09139 [Phytophthora nicotianae]
MAQYYDRNRQAQELAVGDQVLLSTSNLSNFHAVKFHPVFHTSLLKPYVASDRPDQELFKVLLPDGTEGEHVEDIVGYRRKKSGKEYHVKWLGQSKLTWEPEENLKYV